MTTILLIRHAVNDYVKTGQLAGWIPGIHLNDEGQSQAEALGRRLGNIPIQQLYSSPLERALETAQAIQRHQTRLEIRVSEPIAEVRYGDWEGMSLATLRQRKMWTLLQEHPAQVGFPNGETLRAAQTRAVDEIERLIKKHPQEMMALVSHGDIIRMVLAHYLGMHLDHFQRIIILPASISMLVLGPDRPGVMTMNDVAHLLPLESKP